MEIRRKSIRYSCMHSCVTCTVGPQLCYNCVKVVSQLYAQLWYSCCLFYFLFLLFPDFIRDFLLKSRISFSLSKVDDLSHSYINIDARIDLKGVRKIKSSLFLPQISSAFIASVARGLCPKLYLSGRKSQWDKFLVLQKVPLLKLQLIGSMGKIFLHWAQSVKFFIRGRGKMWYLEG